MLKRTCSNWWINFFKDLIEQGLFDVSNTISCECIRFCFFPLLKRDLNAVMSTWNNHKIRPSSNADRRIRPSGRPNVLYYTPSVSDRNVQNYKYPLHQLDFDIVKDTCSKNNVISDYICSPEFFELSTIIMFENSLHMPNNTNEALELYQKLHNKIDAI